MKKSITADERSALFEKLVSSYPGVEVKGATIPYTSVNGNMYSYVSKDGFVALRLPEKIREDFLNKYKTTPVTSYGVVQKEYVTVTDALLQKTAELKPYFAASVEYASGLKPKPTKKAKK